MKPWDDPKTIERFRRMSGAAKVRLSLEMADAQLLILRSGLEDRHPQMGRRRLDAEVAICLWGDSLKKTIGRSSGR